MFQIVETEKLPGIIDEFVPTSYVISMINPSLVSRVEVLDIPYDIDLVCEIGKTVYDHEGVKIVLLRFGSKHMVSLNHIHKKFMLTESEYIEIARLLRGL